MDNKPIVEQIDIDIKNPVQDDVISLIKSGLQESSLFNDDRIEQLLNIFKQPHSRIYIVDDTQDDE